MNPRLKALESRIATKVNRGDQGARSFALTKAMSHEYFKAKKNKKKLKVHPEKMHKDDNHNTEYKKMSQEEFEKKYL